MTKKQELQSKHDSLKKREREIVEEINKNSHTMESKEIRSLDMERRKCVEERREIKKKLSVLDSVLSTLSKRGDSALEMLKEMMKDAEEGEDE